MKAFIKDCTDLGGRTKAFIDVISGNVKEDRLTTANSSFECREIPTNISVGDIFILLNDYSKILYYGKITSITDTKINTSQILSIFGGTFIYSIVDELKETSPTTYLETEIAQVLDNYKLGYIYQSAYQDPMIHRQLGDIITDPIDSLEVGLPTDLDKDGNEQFTSKDMVKWLYELYETYGIVIDFTIPIQDDGNVIAKIWKPTYTSLKITDGFECVTNITPKVEQQSTNKLIIYSKDKVYRDTYCLTENGIEKEPSLIVGRPNQVNTKIVQSDDEIQDLISANLSERLFNHKLEFVVNLNSKLFTFDDLKLDTPIQVFNGSDYYSTLITGKDFSFNDNVISELKLTCGKVRTSLTDKISLGIIK